MAAKYWIKLYLEILDDPKMGRMPNHIWRRAIELFLLAGRNGNDGQLQPVEEMAWILRLDASKLLEDLHCLAEAGVVHETSDGVWVVTHFEKRQDADSSTERSREWRKRGTYRPHGRDETSRDVQRNATYIEEEVDPDQEEDQEREESKEEEGAASAASAFPARQSGDSFVRIFSKVTGMSAIPGTDIPRVMSAMDGLTMQFPDEAELVKYLRPFWFAWTKRVTKDKRPYPRTNCAWLYDWAVVGQIPSEGNGNGSSENLVKQAMALAEARKNGKAA